MNRPVVTIELTIPAYNNLSAFLKENESEIAVEGGMSGLRELFVVVFDDNPEQKEETCG